MDIDLDPNFEPQSFRARSNTWPVRPKDLSENDSPSNSTPGTDVDQDAQVDSSEKQFSQNLLNSKKTGGSRRNAWGNLSYADLITKAIQSSAEQRLTLSQIYDWMVQNVPYFRDKGDSNSSAGWKNSIRHNLSLHSRFMRIQNEGTGKSSWWILNPDAKQGKTPRRRATSMDTKAYEKKRGRVKKKVEALRAAMGGDNLSETGSCYGGSAQDLNIPDCFTLSPQDFRQRTSSNASSIGRLTPIQSMLEPDNNDNEISSLSPLPWNQSLKAPTYGTGNEASFTDQSLSESLAEMFVGEGGIDIGENLLTNSRISGQVMRNTFNTQNYLQPKYTDQLNSNKKQSHHVSINVDVPSRLGCHSQVSPISPGSCMSYQNEKSNHYNPQSLSELLECDGGTKQSFLRQVDHVMASPPPGSTLGQYSALSATNDRTTRTTSCSQHFSNQGGPLSINNSLLRQALTTHSPINIKHANKTIHEKTSVYDHGDITQDLQQDEIESMSVSFNNASIPTTVHHQHMAGGGMVSSLNQTFLPTDIDMNLTADFSGCDVDQILKHELAFDGTLDFNFESEQNEEGSILSNLQGNENAVNLLNI